MRSETWGAIGGCLRKVLRLSEALPFRALFTMLYLCQPASLAPGGMICDLPPCKSFSWRHCHLSMLTLEISIVACSDDVVIGNVNRLV